MRHVQINYFRGTTAKLQRLQMIYLKERKSNYTINLCFTIGTKQPLYKHCIFLSIHPDRVDNKTDPEPACRSCSTWTQGKKRFMHMLIKICPVRGSKSFRCYRQHCYFITFIILILPVPAAVLFYYIDYFNCFAFLSCVPTCRCAYVHVHVLHLIFYNVWTPG